MNELQEDLMNSKSKGRIKKWRDLRKSHVDEAEKLYKRERLCKQEGCESVSFFTGFRFYTIFKKELKAFLLSQNTEKLSNMMKVSITVPDPNSNLLGCIKPMTEKWESFIEFVENNLRPDSDEEDMFKDQKYLLQKGCSAKFVESFTKDYSLVRSTLAPQLYANREEKNMLKEFWIINEKITDTVRILTCSSRFRYPINGYFCLDIAVTSMNFGLVKNILDFLVEESQKEESQQRVSCPYTNHKDILTFGRQLMSIFLSKSFPVDEIMYFLKCFNQLFPSVVFEEKQKNKYIFKSDEDLIASVLIDGIYFRMVLSLELFEKAVLDWRFTKEGVNLIEKCISQQGDVFLEPIPLVSFRKKSLTFEDVIHVFELYEKVNEKCMITDDIIYQYASTGQLNFVKYFCDVRGFKLPFRIPNKIPLIYQYLCVSYDGGEKLLDDIEYFLDKFGNDGEDLFDDAVANIVGTSPIQRIINSVVYGEPVKDKEKLMRVLRKLLARKPNVNIQVHGISIMEYIDLDFDYPYKKDIQELFERYDQGKDIQE